MNAAVFRDPQGLPWFSAALGYALGAWAGGFLLLFQPGWIAGVTGTLLLAHGLVISAYLIHECAHNTVFWSNEANARLGAALGWIVGSAYTTHENIRYKHFRHHVDVDDVAWFDYLELFRRHPRLLRLIRALEWAYIPAHELLMHGLMAIETFVIPERRAQRARNLTVLAVRGAVFLYLLVVHTRVAVLYAVAQMIMMTVLRFMDSLQHDYPYNLTLFDERPGPRRGMKDWEQEHTFSNPLSLRLPWINWLTLNFGYHNAHHARPTTPWFRLPALHRELYGDDPALVIPFRAQAAVFHKYRVARVCEGGGELDETPRPQGREFLRAAQQRRVYGGNAASFLTAF
jgi:fatty acid desaturase